MISSYYKKESIPNTIDGEYILFRVALLEYLETKDYIKGIEIGVYNGNTSAYLLSLSNKIYLTGVDPLIPDSMERSMIGSEQIINNNIAPYKERWKFIKDFSYNVVSTVPDDSLDFIFIDGSHHYLDVKKDWNDYFSKIKSNGLIFMHDSRMNRGGAPFHVGSSKFTDEVIADNKKVKVIGEAFSLTCFKKI